MKILNIALIPLAVAALTLPSCVSKKKYQSAQDNIHRLQGQNARLQGEVNELEKDLTAQSEEYMVLQAKNNKMSQKLAYYNSKSQSQSIQLAELQETLNENFNHLRHVQKLIADALVEYPEDEIDVYLEDGQIHMRMSNHMLFPSGESHVTQNGQKALSLLSSVLKDNPEMRITVEGHTDSVPVSPEARYADNWDLSVMRATDVTRHLVEMGVSPQRLTPAGRSKFDPFASNETANGRQANRRTEIIIQPDLAPIFEYYSDDAYGYFNPPK